MSWSYKIFWSFVVVATMSLAACGQKKDEVKGRPVVAGGSNATTSGTGNKTVVTGNNGATTAATASSTYSPTSSTSNLTVKVSNMTKSPIGDEPGYEFYGTISINNQSQQFMAVINAANVDSGYVAYVQVGNYIVTYQAACSDSSTDTTLACGQLYLSFWVGNSTTQNFDYQLGILKDFNGVLINPYDNSDTVAVQYSNLDPKNPVPYDSTNIKTWAQIKAALDQQVANTP